MMLIAVQVRPSQIHGLGLFTVAVVPAGTPIWRFRSGFDQVFAPAALAALPAQAQAHVHWFGFVRSEDDHWVLSGDHACFMNHAAEPNTGAEGSVGGEVTTVALRAIAAGEELTCDYRAFDAAAARHNLGSRSSEA
jgi:SET domain-containing protein